MIHESVYELRHGVKGALKIEHGKLEVVDVDKLRGTIIDTLARDARLARRTVKEYAQWLIWEAGPGAGRAPGQHPRVLHGPRRRTTGRTAPCRP